MAEWAKAEVVFEDGKTLLKVGRFLVEGVTEAVVTMGGDMKFRPILRLTIIDFKMDPIKGAARVLPSD